MLFIYDYRHLMGKGSDGAKRGQKDGVRMRGASSIDPRGKRPKILGRWSLPPLSSAPSHLLWLDRCRRLFCFASLFFSLTFPFFFFILALPCHLAPVEGRCCYHAGHWLWCWSSGAESGAPEPHLVTYAAMIAAYMYIDDADWLHSLEEASAAHATTCFANCRVCPPCLTHCGALRRSTTKSKSPPARPLKNVTQRANQLLRAFAFSPCSDAEMRSERTHAGPQFLLDCLFCSSTNRFVLSRFFQVVPLAHCIVDSHVRLFSLKSDAPEAVMEPLPLPYRLALVPQQRGEDALDEWFLDDPKKKTLKGFAPLMPPEWQLARIA
eukprot:gene356-201_t